MYFQRCISLSALRKQDDVTSSETSIPVTDDAENADNSRKTGKKQQKKHTKEDRSLRQEEAEEILNFFNNCDRVTLKKLIKISSQFFQSIDVTDCVERDYENNSQLYVDLDDFVERTKIDSSKLLKLYDKINGLRLKEQREFGIPRLENKFPVEKIKVNLD